MKNIKYLLVAFVLFVCSHAAFAQTSVSSYFLDGAFHNNRLNPAMKAERGFFSLLMGNMGIRTKSNFGISDILYPRGNELTTFMSGDVSADEFLGRMPDAATLGFNFDESLLSFGFRAFGGYATFDLSLHSSMSISLPKGLFEFAKRGFQKNVYDVAGINFNTMNYASASLGYSHEVYKGLRVGANLKYLMGLAHANLTVDKLRMEMNDEHWLVESHAQAQAGLFCESKATLDENGVIDGIEFGNMAPSASGFAVDLGVVYDMNEFVPGLTLSASVLDLGFINWKHMMKGQSTDAKVEFDGFGTVDPDNMDATVEDEFEKLGEDAEKLMDFAYNGTESMKTNMNTTMYLGAEYNMPFYKPLSVAVLYGHCFAPIESNRWYDVRGFVNISPLKWLEASVNFGYSTYGANLGWMLNIHPAGFSFFIGSDHMITKVTPQFIPVDDFSAHLTLGVNIPLGKRK